MENKELIVVGTAFAVIVGIAMYMFVAQQKNSNAVIGINELRTELKAENEQLKQELEDLKNHVHITDSIYHK